MIEVIRENIGPNLIHNIFGGNGVPKITYLLRSTNRLIVNDFFFEDVTLFPYQKLLA